MIWFFLGFVVVLFSIYGAAAHVCGVVLALLERQSYRLEEIEKQLGPIADLPADTARAVYREGERRRDHFLATGKELES